MKKQKGFTIVELIAVITILSIIILIMVPTIGNISDNTKKSLRNSQINAIEVSATRYANDYINKYQNCISSYSYLQDNCTINIDDLVDKGYIESKEVASTMNGTFGILVCYNSSLIEVKAKIIENGQYECN